MHYYQFNIGDYLSHTNHLEPLEDLAYRRMLDWCYLHERPLPDDIDQIAKLIRMRSHNDCIASVLREFFDLTPDGWWKDRIGKEIERTGEKSRKASESAKARWQKEKGDANALPPDCESNATHNPIPNTQDPKPSSVSKDTGGKPPMKPDEIIFGYGVPLLTNAGTADARARSFLGGLRKAHGDEALVHALRECIRAKPLQPLEWLAAALPPAGVKPKLNKQEALEASNRAVVERLLKKEGLA